MLAHHFYTFFAWFLLWCFRFLFQIHILFQQGKWFSVSYLFAASAIFLLVRSVPLRKEAEVGSIEMKVFHVLFYG